MKHIDPEAVWGYGRLSQHDPDRDEPLEKRVAVRRQSIRLLAERHGLPLLEDHILFEVVSAAKLAKMPELLRILDEAQRGGCKYLLSSEQARLLRGDKRDEAAMEEVFIEHSVTLITTEGVTEFGSDDYNPFTYEVLAAAARWERAKRIQRQKEKNAARLSMNQRSQGRPPYGYKRQRPPDRPPTEADVELGLAGADSQGIWAWYEYVTIPEEWAIVEEIFRRYLARESLNSIREDLNRRQVPPPGTGRPGRGSSIWWHPTLFQIVSNPLYAGYHARRSFKDPGKKHRTVKVSRIKPAPEERPGHWPTALTLDQWYLIRDRMASNERADRNDLRSLTGVLHCERGRPMHGTSANTYGCHCRELGEPHESGKGYHVGVTRVERYARDLAAAILAAIPDSALNVRPKAAEQAKQKREQIQRDYAAAQRQAQTARDDVDDLMRHRQQHVRRFGSQAYDESCDRAGKALQSAEARVADLREQLQQPDYAEGLPACLELKRIGVTTVWPHITRATQRQILLALVERIELMPIPAHRRCHHDVSVTVRPRWRPLVPAESLPVFNKRRLS